MDIQKIVERFAAIADITVESALPWWELCSESANEINSWIREGVDKEANETRLNTLTAVYSFYKYTLILVSRKTVATIENGFAIATVTDRRNMLSAANNAWKQARGEAADILNDFDFVFTGVK